MARKKLYRFPDKRTIDPEDEYQVAYWSTQLGVSREKLLLAVKANGNVVDDVKRILKNKYVIARN